jgi:Ca2+-binding RTX toxin-like protein
VSLPESIRIDLTTGIATRTQTNPLTGTTSVETDTFSEFENVRGSNRSETIVGNGGINVLEGRGGNDTLQGGGGSDTLDGGSGTDTATYENNLGGRVIVTLGLNGADGTASELTVVGQQIVTHTDTLRSIENVRGTNFNDIITGNEADNVIDGRSGSDTMVGRTGNDTYLVDNALDRVTEAAGEGSQDRVRTSVSYTLTNGSEVEVLETTNQSGTAAINLTGNDGINFIVGNNGANIINGGGNNDRLSGGGGNDTLTGGSGSDGFFFDTALNGATNVDIITDFSVAEVDVILLDDAIFTGLAGTAGNSITLQEFRIGTAAQDADDHIIYNNVTGALLYDADGIGGTAAVQFATLSSGLALTNGLIGII